MYALTIKPIWANKIITGKKLIENRSWATKWRGEIAIHAAKPQGEIIGTVQIADILTVDEALRLYPEQKEHISGPLCWVLKNPKKIKPLKWKGQLRLWIFENDSLLLAP